MCAAVYVHDDDDDKSDDNIIIHCLYVRCVSECDESRCVCGVCVSEGAYTR